MQLVDVGRLATQAYRGVAPDKLLDALERVASSLQGVRVLHINATPYGGGVSELLRSVVPVLRGLGLVADWRIIAGDQSFFEVTKTIHNALQGASIDLSAEQWSVYEANARLNAAVMDHDYDIVFVHDPQPLALPVMGGRGGAKWVWRCHIDTSEPSPEVWAHLHRFLEPYDAAVFTMAEFVPADLPPMRVDIIPPAIDPLSPKNMALPTPLAQEILQWIGVDTNAPLVTQVSRFDPWKDPLGVIAAYRMAREQIPDLQLAMVASMALDDPQGWGMYRKITEESGDDLQIHLFTNLTGAGNVEVNAFQAQSDIVVQKSIREGFGLVVSEAMWKATPVIAGRTGGIALQTADGSGGVLVDDVEACAREMVDLLRDPQRAREAGQRGQDRVRDHFLLPRLLLSELILMREVLEGRAAGQLAGIDHDPVCGIVLTQTTTVANHRGQRYAFCSNRCRDLFLAQPERYLRQRWSA